jgi:carboxyl-terminal processing protease
VSSSSQLFKRVFLPALLFFAVAGFATRFAVDRDFRSWFDPAFWHAWMRVGYVMNLAHQDYLHPEAVTYDKLSEHALDHLLDGLDPYTTYLPPNQYRELTDQGNQTRVGVGVEIEKRQGRVQVTHVFPDGPAFSAQWQVGDRIVAIGDTDTRDFSVDDVSKLLRGPEDTQVKVTLDRPGSSDPLVQTLTRHSFDIPSIRDAELYPNGVGYMRLTEFGRNSGEEFSRQLRQFEDQGMSALVLDLRDNGGGLLDAAPEVLNPLLKAGQLVTYTEGIAGENDEQRYTTSGAGDVHFAGPMAVLVNENSASAAEIVAGALQVTRRAVLVGQRTYGKGIVQSVVDLGDGSGVRLTTQAYFLPNGTSINAKGIEPNVPVPLSPGQSELLGLQRDDLRRLTPEEFTQFYGFAPQPDPQFETAIAIVLAAGDHYFLPLPKAASAP